MHSLLEDLGTFVRSIAKTAWGKVSVASGIVTLVLRSRPDLEPPTWLPALFIAVIATSLLYAIFSVFRQQKREVESLVKAASDRTARNADRARLLWNEIQNNLDGFNYPIRYQDEMFKQHEVDPVTGLSELGKAALATHYNYARSLRAMVRDKVGPKEESHMQFLYTGLKEAAGKATSDLTKIFNPRKGPNP